MTVKVYGKPDTDRKEWGLTKGKEYPIVKITYPKLNPEGMVTFINDYKCLERISSAYFEFEAK